MKIIILISDRFIFLTTTKTRPSTTRVNFILQKPPSPRNGRNKIYAASPKRSRGMNSSPSRATEHGYSSNIRHTWRVSFFERVSAAGRTGNFRMHGGPRGGTVAGHNAPPALSPAAVVKRISSFESARAHSGLRPDVEENRRGIYVPGRRRIWPFKFIRPRSIGKLD